MNSVLSTIGLLAANSFAAPLAEYLCGDITPFENSPILQSFDWLSAVSLCRLTCCLVWVNRCSFAGNPTGSYAPEPYVCGNTKRVVSEHCLLRPHSVSPHSSSAASSSGLTVALSPATQQRKTATSQTALVRQGRDHLGKEAHLQPEMQTSQAHLRP